MNSPIRPSIPPAIFNRWKQTAIKLGYGEYGRLKFLEIVMDMADESPALFRKR